MKLKLKVTKTLKRNLRQEAEKASLERNDYIMEHLMSHIESQKTIWESTVDSYPATLEKRQSELEKLKETLEENEVGQEEKRQQLLDFYQENHMYRVIYSRKKKFENIILNLEDRSFYALCLISENNHKAVELYTVDYLSQLVKQP